MSDHRYLIESHGSVERHASVIGSILLRLATRFNTSNPNKEKPGYLQRFCFLYLARLCRDPLEVSRHQ